jgi:hypothetical protein
MNPRIIAALVALLGVAALGNNAWAQSDDVQQNENRREARLVLPRLANGSIDIKALTAAIHELFSNGVREVRIRDLDLNAQDRQQLADLAQQLTRMHDLGRVRMIDGGKGLRIDLRNEQEARENPHDEHEDRADRRDDPVGRFERDEIAERPQATDQVDRPEQVERPERQERAERQERVERPERRERVERIERVERVDRHERHERPEKPERRGRH